MRLLVLNPNSNHAMTEAVVASVCRYVPTDTEVTGWTAQDGPPVIKDRATFDTAAAGMPSWVQSLPEANGILLACFGDPGLDALRALTNVPLIGLAEAAIAHARQCGDPFAIITAGAAWAPLLTHCVETGGALSLLVGIYTLQGDGAMLKAQPERFQQEVLRLSHQARQDGARRLILGGAAFEGLSFQTAPGLVLDGPVALATNALLKAMHGEGSSGK